MRKCIIYYYHDGKQYIIALLICLELYYPLFSFFKYRVYSMYGLLLQTYNTSYGYDDNSVERIIIPVGINECAKKSHSKKKRKRIIKGPTGATGLNGPQGFTGEMGTTGASGSTGLSGGGAILSFGTAGILNLDLATDNSSFTLGFASAYSGSILVGQDINMPGAMYIRVPRSGILQNLYLAVQIYNPALI